jgi:uncharacterized membrane-anchored protein
MRTSRIYARVSNRFNGSAAYFSLLESRFAELREEKIEHALRLSRFVMRRLSPAVQTCRSVHERLTNLYERIDRAAEKEVRRTWATRQTSASRQARPRAFIFPSRRSRAA